MIAPRSLGAALGFSLLAATPVLSQLDESFMPKGGKTLLLQLVGGDLAQLRKIAAARGSEAEWSELLAPRIAPLQEKERRTLVAYLAVNMPVPEASLAAVGSPADVAKSLPRDGRDLAWNECQFCHSLFTSHLTQDRDERAWLNMFQSPFHREMKMTAREREEFARYSAINMPMKTEDVPAELRF
jgi:hypothetical protein